MTRTIPAPGAIDYYYREPRKQLTNHEVRILRLIRDMPDYDLTGTDVHHFLHLWMSGGAVYDCLYRLAYRQMLRSWQGIDQSNRLVRFYTMTALGMAELIEQENRELPDVQWTPERHRRH